MAEIRMPRLSDTMEEGTIARWLKQPGDSVARGDVLAEIETDKATMDLEAYEAGVLEQILLPEGESAPIGSVVALVGSGEGAPPAPATPAPPPTRAAPAPATAPAAAPPAPAAQADGAAPGARGQGAPGAEPVGPGRRPPSSPLARAIARRAGIDLSAVVGSGPGGRIVRADVERLAAGAGPGRAGPAGARPSPASPPSPAFPPSPASPAEGAGGVADEEVALGTLRRITAERLTESARAPHFNLTLGVDAEELLRLRSQLNEVLAPEGEKLTVTDLVVRACALTLRRHPEVNASWGGDRILRHRGVHVGIAVAVPEGLLVPVVRDADRISVRELARRARELAERARARRLSPDELSGGTFTVSNLGMYGIEQFSAIINPPQAAILAVGAALPQAVVRDGVVCARTTMQLTLSIDHRVLDGATGAGYLADLKAALESPAGLLL